MFGRKRLVGGLAGVTFTAGLVLAGTLPAGGQDFPRKIQTRLTGEAEVPGPGDPDGKGRAAITGVNGQPDLLCYRIEARRIAPATAAHIHEGPPDVAGPIVVTLEPPTRGRSSACVETPLAQEILAEPHEYYVNVHNADYPAGAIRGQLSRS